MTRDKYIDKCIKASFKIRQYLRVQDVEWTDIDLVIYDGIKYYPFGYILRFENGNAVHIAELRSLKTSSVTYALIDKVKEIDYEMQQYTDGSS